MTSIKILKKKKNKKDINCIKLFRLIIEEHVSSEVNPTFKKKKKCELVILNIIMNF
jgi:hypothetical protein